MKPDGSGERILTEGFHNEGPTFAPNGRVLMFFRDPGGSAGPSLYTVDITGRNEQRVPTPGFASDPAWSPLLSCRCRTEALAATGTPQPCATSGRHVHASLTIQIGFAAVGAFFAGLDNVSSRLTERSLNEPPARPGSRSGEDSRMEAPG